MIQSLGVTSGEFFHHSKSKGDLASRLNDRYAKLHNQFFSESLADEFVVIIEGAFILAKSFNDPDIVVRQLQHYRNYLELVFQQEASL